MEHIFNYLKPVLSYFETILSLFIESSKVG